MSKYRRRFSRDEFRNEIFTHLKDMPPQYLREPDKLEEIAKWKAEHYARALDALDAAKSRLEKLARTHRDSDAQEDAKLALKEIDDAINAYGEASLSGNSKWTPFDSEN